MNLHEVLLWFIFKENDNVQTYEENNSDISCMEIR